MRRIQYLDSVRGLAALAVVFYHFMGHRWGGTPWYPKASIIFNGSDAVALFFVLSGLVLSWKYFHPDESMPLDGPHYRQYVVNRVVRLYVPFLAALAIYYLDAHWESSQVQMAKEFLVNQHNWFEEALLIRSRHDLYVPAWTLEVELAASLLLPFLVLLLRYNRQLFLLLAAVLLVLGSPLVFWGLISFQMGMWLTYNFAAIQACDIRQTRWYPYRYVLYIGVLLLFSIRHLTRLYPLGDIGTYWMNLLRLDLFHFTSLAAFLMLAYLINRPRLQHWLSSRPLLFLGRISYSVYLIHWYVIKVAMNYWDSVYGTSLDTPSNVAVRLLTVLLGTLVLATLLNILVERPAIRLGKRLSERLVRIPAAPQPVAN